MPISRYDKYFGGARGSAEEALRAMKHTYGAKEGEQVFWAAIAKRKRKSGPQRKRAKR